MSKKGAIDYLVAYRELHSLEFCALALANIYGPRQDPHGEAGVVAIFAERLVLDQPVTVFGDGEQTRDFVYVDDVVDAFVRAADRGGGLVCNIGTGRETSVNELVAVMAERAGVEPRVDFQPLRPGRAPTQRPRSDPGGHAARLASLDRARRGDRGGARLRASASRPRLIGESSAGAANGHRKRSSS